MHLELLLCVRKWDWVLGLPWRKLLLVKNYGYEMMRVKRNPEEIVLLQRQKINNLSLWDVGLIGQQTKEKGKSGCAFRKYLKQN